MVDSTPPGADREHETGRETPEYVPPAPTSPAHTWTEFDDDSPDDASGEPSRAADGLPDRFAAAAADSDPGAAASSASASSAAGSFGAGSSERWRPIGASATHSGLADADPWDVGVPARSAAPLWPWGLKGFAETLEVIGLALLMFILVRGVAQNFIVDGGSMEPNFHSGQMLIVNKLAYRSFDVSWLPWTDNDDWRPFGDPRPGDVVVFHFPLDPSRDFIKRVIAVPGQTVEVRDGSVIVDGVVQEESYIADPARYEFPPQEVPEDHVFVLGDARNNSFDSHQWGMLSREFIIGKTELRYWPLGDLGLVGGSSPVPVGGTELTLSP